MSRHVINVVWSEMQATECVYVYYIRQTAPQILINVNNVYRYQASLYGTSLRTLARLTHLRQHTTEQIKRKMLEKGAQSLKVHHTDQGEKK